MTHPLAIYKLLPQTNCGRCYLPSCLAFAGAVATGGKRLGDCPFIDPAVADPEADLTLTDGDETDPVLATLEDQVRSLDFAATARRTGGRLDGDGLVITCLGKPFTVHPDGSVSSECHTNAWMRKPLLQYLVHCRSSRRSGDWLPLRDLPGGMAHHGLFQRRCEAVLLGLADEDPAFFGLIGDLFGGLEKTATGGADLVLELLPFPHLPIRICYWQPEEELGSQLSVLFDPATSANLPLDTLVRLGASLARMFEAIARQHR